MIYRGKVFKYGDNVDTDVIIPARYLTTYDAKELGRHCLEDLDPEFVKKTKRGDIIVAGENFGCGSSREHAPLAIKGAGVSCVVAKSFARIFFRNAINIGLPIVELDEVEEIKEGDILEVDTDKGEVRNITSGRIYKIKPYPSFIQQIIEAGGLIPYVSSKIVKNK